MTYDQFRKDLADRLHADPETIDPGQYDFIELTNALDSLESNTSPLALVTRTMADGDGDTWIEAQAYIAPRYWMIFRDDLRLADDSLIELYNQYTGLQELAGKLEKALAPILEISNF